MSQYWKTYELFLFNKCMCYNKLQAMLSNNKYEKII